MIRIICFFVFINCINAQTTTISVTEYGKYSITASNSYDGVNYNFLSGIDVYRGINPAWQRPASQKYYEKKGWKNFPPNRHNSIIGFESGKNIFLLCNNIDGNVFLQKYDTEGEFLQEYPLDFNYQVIKDIHKNFILLKDGFLLSFKGISKVIKFDFEGKKMTELINPNGFEFVELEYIDKQIYLVLYKQKANGSQINCETKLQKFNESKAVFEDFESFEIENIYSIYDFDIDGFDSYIFLSDKKENNSNSIGIHKFSKKKEFLCNYVITSQNDINFNGFEIQGQYSYIIFGIRDVKSIQANGGSYTPNTLYKFSLINKKKDFDTTGSITLIKNKCAFKNLFFLKDVDGLKATFENQGCTGNYFPVLKFSEDKSGNYELAGELFDKVKNIYFYEF